MVHEGISAGDLAGVVFTSTAFTITCSADLSARQAFSSGFWMDHATASIDIAGVGNVTFTSPTRTFVNQNNNLVGFSRGGANGLDLFNGPMNPSFATWDMTSPIGPVAGLGSTIQWTVGDVLTSGGVLNMEPNGGATSVFTATLGGPGTTFCSAVANSTGLAARISSSGSAMAVANDITLRADRLPTNQFAYFLTSMDQGFIPMPGGSQGNLCLTGGIGRYVGPGQIQNTGSSGLVSLPIDLLNIPTPTGFVPVTAGQTWNFQLWYRDVNPSTTSNFTEGLSLTFQ